MPVDALHVVMQVEPPRKAIAVLAAVAGGVDAQVRAVAVAVHSVSFALVSQPAGRGGEPLTTVFARRLLAFPWLQMSVKVFAAGELQLVWTSMALGRK